MISNVFGINVHRLLQEISAQKWINPIATSTPRHVIFRRAAARSGLSTEAAAESRPPGMTQNPRIGRTMRLAGMVTRESR
jgi:hypothetical protein